LGSIRKTIRQRITIEFGLFFGLLFVGLVLVPIAIYVVGGKFFGEYAGNGYNEFFSSLSTKVRSGDRVSWFLIFSPYLTILVLRLVAWGWRRTS
jgi:hypothetical protein